MLFFQTNQFVVIYTGLYKVLAEIKLQKLFAQLQLIQHQHHFHGHLTVHWKLIL